MNELEKERKLQEQLESVRKASIKPGSPEHEAYLAAGYPKIRTRKHASEIIAKYEGGSPMYPYELYEDALAFIEALDAKPTAKNVYHPPTNQRGEVIMDNA